MDVAAQSPIRLVKIHRWLIWGVCCAWIGVTATPNVQAGCVRPQDEVILISTRHLNTCCFGADGVRRLSYRQLVPSGQRGQSWVRRDADYFLSGDDPQRLTVVYVHGNRIENGEDASRGLAVYRALLRDRPHAPPVRMVIYSWPSSKIRGPLRDIRAKAPLADCAGLRLAQLLAEMKTDPSLSIISYSYGARVAEGAMHLLGGGLYNGRPIANTSSEGVRSIRAVFMSAAVDNDWLLPGRRHEHAMNATDNLMLMINPHDSVLKYYHFTARRRRPCALGQYGITNPSLLGTALRRVTCLNVYPHVGEEHDLEYYLASHELMAATWDHIATGAIQSNFVPSSESFAETTSTSAHP